ncbi:hypothetical protein M1397_03820 [Candidatus Marsarchaeota archaeon]|jgi:uncharacterized protein (UPF0333 family)|nr:hypothetical protein [Candidatus Marsarchaeota archaeon]
MRIGIPYMTEMRALWVCRTKGQGSLEYIMMLSAVGIIIVIALAMIMQLKGTALHAFVNSSNQSVSSQLAHELQNLTNST